jgi:hypothetical protein
MGSWIVVIDALIEALAQYHTIFDQHRTNRYFAHFSSPTRKLQRLLHKPSLIFFRLRFRQNGEDCVSSA